MKKSTLFDIISPIMIGPSSSHTAGAVRLGLLAKNIYKHNPKKVIFTLYNSYATTGKGHGTEKGLLSGVLGLNVDDVRIKNIFDSDIAKTVDYEFRYKYNFKYHPNTVDIMFEGDMPLFISGVSVGAGEVYIRKIKDFSVKLTGKYNTLVLVYQDKPGIISFVTSLMQKNNINIAFLNCDRDSKGHEASMVLGVDGVILPEILDEIEKMNDVYFVSYVKKLDN